MSAVQASAAYMFTDAWNDAAAHLNPLRWSRSLRVQELADHLLEHRTPARPVRLRVDTEDGRITKVFQDTRSAAQWLCTTFDSVASLTETSDEVSTLSGATAMQYMWVDITCGLGFLGGGSHSWSSKMAPAELAQHLEAITSHNRPVKVRVKQAGAWKERGFTSRDEALHWLHEYQEEAKSSDEEEAKSSDEEVVHATSPRHLDDEQVATARVAFMWGDAGVLPLKVTQGLAQSNPLRWSATMAPGEAVTQLSEDTPHNRPVRLSVKTENHRELKSFESKELAVQWLRDVFGLGGAEQEEAHAEHKCVVCLEADVTVMLMPCRHAVLCDDCAVPILAGTAKCPICREQIANHAKGRFVDDYVDLVQAMEARVERSGAVAYDGMYNHVKPLMVIGALLGTGAAVCFALAPPAAPLLAGAAFAVGYLPWFATTVAHFEQEDVTGRSQLAPSSFFSHDDLGRPLVLIAKTLTMAVVAPVAALLFFVPYGLYAGVLRPGAKALVRGLIRASALAHVYVLRPTAHALQAVCQAIVRVLREIGQATHSTAVMLGELLAAAGRRTSSALSAVAELLKQRALYCGERISDAAAFMYDNVLHPVGSALYGGAVSTATGVNNAVLFVGRKSHEGASCVGRGLATGAETVYEYAIVPTGMAARRGLNAISHAGATCALQVHDYVLLPGGRAMVFALRTLGDGLVGGARATYTYVLVPLADGVAAGAQALYSGVLVPLGQGAQAALALLGRGLAHSAKFLYRNALTPLGVGAWMLVKGLGYAVAGVAYGAWRVASGGAHAIAFGAAAAYSCVILPVGRGLAFGASATASGVAAGATAIYRHALAPVGHGIAYGAAATASGLATGASMAASGVAIGATAVYTHALAPAGRGLACGASAAASGVAAGASIAYVFVLRPAGAGAYHVGASTVAGVCTAGEFLHHQATAGAQVAYVYVIQPTGQVICLGTVAARDALVACGQEVQRTSVAAGAGVHQASVAAGAAVQQAVRETSAAVRASLQPAERR